MKITAVLQGLLLATLTYSEDNCRESIQKEWYNVYNVSMYIDAYYCSFTSEDDSRCKNSDNGVTLTKSVFTDRCNGLSGRMHRLINRIEKQPTLCKMPARLNLAEDTVTLPNNMPCRHSDKECDDKNNSRNIFWAVDGDICRKIPRIHSNTFSVWSNIQDRSMFVRDVNIALVLKEKFTFCSVEASKTNHDGIVVSPWSFGNGDNKLEVPKLQSNFKEFCHGKSSVLEQNSTNVSKMWYIYKYPTDVTVHVCLTNQTKSCEDLNVGETVSENNLNLLDRCRHNFCDSQACKGEKSTVTLCRKTLEVDLENDSVRELPKACKYSDGICKSLNTFWQYTDRCSTIKKVYEALEKHCGSRRCVKRKDDSTNLIFDREGKLCGENVWYTDQGGVVASERELCYHNETNEDILTALARQQGQEISNLQISLYCVMLLFSVCFLWYVFNVIVNFVSLRRLNKMRTAKDGVCLMNCISQSLTAHHLSLHRREKKDTSASGVQTFQLYASVDNELYNKPVKLPLKR